MSHFAVPTVHTIGTTMQFALVFLLILGVACALASLFALLGALGDRKWGSLAASIGFGAAVGVALIWFPLSTLAGDAAAGRDFQHKFTAYTHSDFGLDIPADQIPLPPDSYEGDVTTLLGHMGGKPIDVKLVRHGSTFDVYIPSGGPMKKLTP